jgi:hypothetical protein
VHPQEPTGPALALRSHAQHTQRIVEPPQQENSSLPAPIPRLEGPLADDASTSPLRTSRPVPSQIRDAVLPIGLDPQQVQLAREIERTRIHFIHSEFIEGDTLVFLDCPDCPRDYPRQADCSGIRYRSQQLLVHSEKLLKTGSSKFAEMLGPTYQFRIQRRRRMVNKMPEGVKFLLDLTPPNEGDELVFQMTELSLTPGLIKWWTASKIHKIDEALVAGHDDVCHCSLTKDEPEPDPTVPYKLDEQEVPPSQTPITNQSIAGGPGGAREPEVLARGSRIDPFKLEEMKMIGENKLFNIPAFRNIPDYCPYRHRNSITRLLLLIEGKHVMIDSATRLWTLAGVAKILDCPSVLRGQVTQWIMHGNNMRFIEVLPEEALKLGYTLQIPEVTQCAFRILVNELALEDAATPGTNPAKHVTVFGRRKGDAGDELSNLVQHAARELVERVTNQLQELRSPHYLDSRDYAPWHRLLMLECELQKERHRSEAVEEALHILQGLMSKFRDTIPQTLDRVEKTSVVYGPSLHTGIDFDRATYVEPRDFTPLEKIMGSFNFVQKLLCPMVYHQLADEMEYTTRLGELFRDLPSPHIRVIVGLTKSAEEALQRLNFMDPRVLGSAEFDDFFQGNRQRDGFNQIVRSPLIDAHKLGEYLFTMVQPFLSSWVRHDIEPPLNMTRHMLLTLNSNEMKFLPLWAGGCNDGTGGVFERYVPLTELGPNGPGPSYHTGITLPSAPSSSAGTMVEDFRGMKIMGSTTAGSIDVQDSISTVYRPDRVIADDVSIRSEVFTETGSGFQEARFAVPAPGQGISQALEMICDTPTDDDSISVVTDVQPVVAEGGLAGTRHELEAQIDEDGDEIEIDDAASFSWDECGSGDDDMDMF